MIMKAFYLSLSLFAITFQLHSKDDKGFAPVNNSLVEAGVSAVVNGCVNVITGDFVDSSVDVVIPGPEPLTLERSYASSDYDNGCFYHGWRHNHQSWIEVADDKDDDTRDKALKGKYMELSGRGLFYKGLYPKKDKPVTIGFSLWDSLLGYTNCSEGVISARNNPKHNQITYDHKKKKIKLTTASGSRRIFAYSELLKPFRCYSLVDEIKPNRRRLRYDRNEDGWVSAVYLSDHGDSLHSGLFFYHPSKHDVKKECEFEVGTHDGRKVFYKLQKFVHREKAGGNKKEKVRRYLISEVDRPNAPKENYEYDYEGHPMMTKRLKPDNRYTNIEYYIKKNEKFGDEEVEVDSDHEFRKYRVKQLKAPVGTDDTPIVTHRFYYSLDRVEGRAYQSAINRSGVTRVHDAYDHVTRYFYSKSHRLTEIRKYAGTSKHQIYSQEVYIWGKNNTEEPGYLKGNYFVDSATGSLKHARMFNYDEYGNVIRDTFYGNISGKSGPLNIVNENVCNGCEGFGKTYTYGLGPVPHLMTSEVDDNGKGTLFTYVDGTELLASKLITDHGKIKIRYFYEYDANGVLVKSITDDGSCTEIDNLSSVTQRLITKTTPRTQLPIGLPEKIEEFYLELTTGQEKLIKCTINSHTKEGFLTKQEIYDSNDAFAYALEWEHDNHGNIIREKNALGQVTERKFDSNDNLIYEQGPSKNQSFEYTYDYSNRLIKILETRNDGEQLATSFKYDLLGNKIAEIDPFGHQTDYHYDEFSRLTNEVYPAIPNEGGALVRTQIENQYDVSGNIIKANDQRGESTHFTYNVYGKPTSIKAPDGSQELFEYNLDGSLKEHTQKNGTIEKFSYDFLGRVLSKTLCSSDGQELSKTTYEYSPFNLLSNTDPSGLTTYYDYDNAGRLIATRKGPLTTENEYDSLGRLCVVKEWYSDNDYRCKKQTLDLLNRVIEETVEEGNTGKMLRKVNYKYDLDGNVISKSIDTHAGLATSYVEYNAAKQPIKEIDALGNETIYQYNYRALNQYGQNVLEITKIDPLGNQMITTMNAQDKPGMVIRKNSMGKLLAKKEMFYSGTLDCQYVVESVVTPGKSDRKITHKFDYDAFHQLRDIVEAQGTPEQKRTQINYNNFGQKESIVKPDGTIICHRYDLHGRLAEFYASDNSFKYTYEYDANDHPIKIIDLLTQTETRRSYDPYGRMITEKLANGIAIEYLYDHIDRPTQVSFPDLSSIQYTYDAINLVGVSRISSTGNQLYTHAYNDFDLSGNFVEQQFSRHAGTETVEHDLLGRMKIAQGSNWQEEVAYDRSGNVTGTKITDPALPLVSNFTYDDMYQLKSEDGVASHKYVFDSQFNCVSCDGKSRTINNLNQLVEYEGIKFTYDKNGNRQSKNDGRAITKYAYDSQDRLTEVIKNNEKWAYTYDAFNRRISKQTFRLNNTQWKRTATEFYIYQGQNEVGTCDTNLRITELRLLGIGKGAEIGASIAFEFDQEVFVPIHDHNGNVMNVIDAQSGETVERYRYSAFGEEKIFDQNGQNVLASPLGNSWRFSSKRVDPETGLIYFSRRYYDPETVTWTCPDPIGFEGGPNLYAYVLNNPVGHIDLYGLAAVLGQRKHTPLCYLNYAMSRLSGTISKIPMMETVGKVVECAGRHFVPIPIVEGVVRSTGNFLAGRGIKWEPFCGERSGALKSVGFMDHTLGLIGYLFVPGMMNDKNSAMANANLISKELGGQYINPILNASHGFIKQLGEIILQKLGIDTEVVRVTAAKLRELTSQYERVIVDAHSQGGLITYRALQGLTSAERAKIEVFTYGSAKIIDKEPLGLADARNYVCWKDPIPFISDPIGCIKGMCSRGNVNFIRSNYMCHSLNCGAYSFARSARSNRSRIFNKNYGLN